MALPFTVVPLRGVPPRLTWYWNAETRILIGRFPVSLGTGFTGSVEITGDDGAIVVLDAQGGWLSGVEIVVWPGAEVDAALVMPTGLPGRVGVPGTPTASGIGVEEVETAMEADVTPDRSRLHILVGAADPTRIVQVADRLLIELDAADGVAGLWLDAIPPPPGVAA